MDLIFGNSQNSYDVDTLSIDSVEMIISKFLHAYGGSDREWICNAIYSSLKMKVDILTQSASIKFLQHLQNQGSYLN